MISVDVNVESEIAGVYGCDFELQIWIMSYDDVFRLLVFNFGISFRIYDTVLRVPQAL